MTATAVRLLPTEKAPPRKGLDGKKILVFGAAKVGKTTLASQLDPDHTLFIATEPGQDAIEAYKVGVTSWQEFRDVGAELAQGDHDFKWVVVDTIDELARLCVEAVVDSLAEGADLDRKKFIHVNDFGYGKGPDAVTQEFRLRIAKLCNLGFGVVFISHEKEAIQKTRSGLEVSKLSPDVGQKGMRKWLLGFVDFITYASVIQTTEGEQRVLRLKPSEQVEAGGRVPDERRDEMPELIPLSAVDLRATLDKALA